MRPLTTSRYKNRSASWRKMRQRHSQTGVTSQKCCNRLNVMRLCCGSSRHLSKLFCKYCVRRLTDHHDQPSQPSQKGANTQRIQSPQPRKRQPTAVAVARPVSIAEIVFTRPWSQMLVGFRALRREFTASLFLLPVLAVDCLSVILLKLQNPTAFSNKHFRFMILTSSLLISFNRSA